MPISRPDLNPKSRRPLRGPLAARFAARFAATTENAQVRRNQLPEHLVNNKTCSLCGRKEFTFQPPPKYCGSCLDKIGQKAFYYSFGDACTIPYGVDADTVFCNKCFKASVGNNIRVGEVAIPKTNFVKKKDSDDIPELWVKCGKCKTWQHQICALVNGESNKDVPAGIGHTCPSCLLQEMKAGVRNPLPQYKVLSAKNLPSTKLSNHLEERLFRCLQKERQDRANIYGKNFDEVPGAEGLVVRVVSLVDKKVEVMEAFRLIFQEEQYPAEFPYKSKGILLFQKVEGADVCLFAIYVQEFGAECSAPNQRRVNISYVDSVKHFRPEIKTVTGEALRTFVYQEILIGYLDYCKQRGFTSCYIWSCPCKKQDDYIFYRHPTTQRIPNPTILLGWYQTVIQKAASENIVVEETNFYDYYMEPSSDCKVEVSASRLPYFDGDYWPEEAEKLLLKKDTVTKVERNLRAAKRESSSRNQRDIPLMQHLEEKFREGNKYFIMVHLQHYCKHCCQHIISGSRWVCNDRKNFHLCDRCHSLEQKNVCGKLFSYTKVEVESVPTDTSDEDGILQSEYIDTRLMFLIFCMENYYQFDTLRRAKHSTMMILYHLHNILRAAVISSCVVCHRDMCTSQGWYCKTCTDYDLCDSCYKTEGEILVPRHELGCTTKLSDCNLLLYKAKRRQRQFWQMMLALLVHASKCASCTNHSCHKLKMLFRHGSRCKTRAGGGCKHCMKMWVILKMHATVCKELECRVLRCRDLKEHMTNKADS